MNAISNAAMIAHAAAVAPRDYVMQPPRRMDRITFKTADEGELAGYVSMISQHIGNGQKFAWVELDNALPGSFRGVPLDAIDSCDDCGDDRSRALADPSVRRLCLSDYSGQVIDQIIRGASVI